MTAAGKIHDGLRGMLERSRQTENFIASRVGCAVHVTDMPGTSIDKADVAWSRSQSQALRA